MQVLGRTSRQVKQLRRGLKETLIWPLLTERKDTIPLLFPRASDLQCTPRVSNSCSQIKNTPNSFSLRITFPEMMFIFYHSGSDLFQFITTNINLERWQPFCKWPVSFGYFFFFFKVNPTLYHCMCEWLLQKHGCPQVLASSFSNEINWY